MPRLTKMYALFSRLMLVLVAAVAVFGGVSEASADIFACFSALAPLDEAAKAAEVAAKAGACSSEATGDPAMAMTIAALTAAAVGGAFSTTSQCNAQINGAVGRVVATALLQVPLPDDAKRMLKDFASGATPLTLGEIVAAFPELAAVPLYLQCGCAVAGAPGEFKKIASDYADTVESCGSFFSDAVSTFLDGAQSVGESIHEALNGTPKVPGPQMEQICYPPEVVPDGLWTKSQIFINPPSVCNVIILTCAPGHVVVHKTDTDGNVLSACAAKCPGPEQTFEPGGSCYYTTGYRAIDGVCTPEAQGTCCATGQKVTAWGVCSPACQNGVEYWDVKTDRCARCPLGWHPVYPSSDSSVGSCEPCPPGQNCTPVLLPPKADTHIPICPDGMYLVNGVCGRTSVPVLPKGPLTRTCPPGSRPNQNGTGCVATAPPPPILAAPPMLTAPVPLRPVAPQVPALTQPKMTIPPIMPRAPATVPPAGISPRPPALQPPATAPLIAPHMMLVPQ